MPKRTCDAPRPITWWQIPLLCTAVAVLAVPLAHAQSDEILAPMGGDGGQPFLARCPQGELLNGMDLWAGADIAAIRPICVPGVAGQFHTYPTVFGSPEKKVLGVPTDFLQQVVCPQESPIVIGMDVLAEGREVITINDIDLYCGKAVAIPQQFTFPLARFSAPHAQKRGIGGTNISQRARQQRCPAGLVGVGLDGRAGLWVDAVGLICGAALPPPPPPPPEDPNAVRPAGRVKLPGSTSATSSVPICESARLARARNNPAAPGLEAQCRAQESLGFDALAARGPEVAAQDPLAAELRNQQPDGPVRRGFDIGMAAAEWQTSQGPGKQRIHDALGPAEQEGFSTAVSFSLARNRQKLVDLSVKGPAITNQDPLAVLLRSQQPDDRARRGFDVGMAAAEGQTAPGPGKQKIHDALPREEQDGFAAAVTFSLDRNSNKAFAAKGAAAAKSNAAVAAARNAAPDAFYRLGFDIATGFFAQQAGGTVAMLKLRDTLGGPTRRGFDAAVELNPGRR